VQYTSSQREAIQTLGQFLAHRPYQAAFLLVHPHISRLQTMIEELSQQYDWPLLLVGKTMSQALYRLAPDQRPRQAARLLSESLHQYTPGPLLCQDIDLLFEPTLHLDPLRLLLAAGRQTTLIIAWPGTSDRNTLAYAVPEHAHYRAWSRSELCDYCVVQL
jgi:hypothetical protein